MSKNNSIIKYFLILTTAILVCSGTLLAEDSIETEIVAHQGNSTVNKISAGRQMLLEKIRLAEIQKAQEVFEFLETKIDTNTYASFYQGELFDLAILLKQYDIIKSTQVLDSMTRKDYERSQKNIIPPQNDGLLKELAKILESNKEGIIKDSENNLKSNEIEFLKLMIEYLSPSNMNKWSEINGLADSFLKNYPNDKYEDFIRKYIRHVYKYGEKGWDFYIGLGETAFAGEIADYVPSNIGMALGLDIYRNKIMFNLDLNGNLAADTKKEFTNKNDIWPNGTKVSVTTISGQIGYKIGISTAAAIYPFVGYASHSLYPDYQLTQQGFNPETLYSKSVSYGACFDIPVGKAGYIGSSMSITKLRFKLAVTHPIFTDDLKGTRFSIMVTINPSFWSVRREY